jgi:hypothetical protein
MITISERFRFKALASEVFARDATNTAIRDAWTEISIEWHALANRAAQETGGLGSAFCLTAGRANV